jgi:hypothetical protein
MEGASLDKMPPAWRVRFFQNTMSRPTLLYSGIVLLILLAYELWQKRNQSTELFFALEGISLIFVSLFSLRNYELLADQIKDLYRDKNPREVWVNTRLHWYSTTCIVIFVLCLFVLAGEWVNFYAVLLGALYIFYCLSNRSMLRFLPIDQNSSEPEKKRYYSLIATTIILAKTENMPSMRGYVFLAGFANVATFGIWYIGGGGLPKMFDNFENLLKAYIAGAATLHLAISSANFSKALEFSPDDHGGEITDLMIAGIDMTDKSGQAVANCITKSAEATQEKIRCSIYRTMAWTSAVCLLVSIVIVLAKTGHFLDKIL